MLDAEVLPRLRRRSVEGELALDEQHHRVAEVDVVEGVGDEHDGLALVAQLAQQEHERLFQAGIEAAGRLVEQQQRRLRQQLGGDRDALALSAGEKVDGDVGALAELEGGEHVGDPARALASASCPEEAGGGP